MSIACPYCKAVLNPKGLKPGRFTPKCPGCARPFLLLVPEDETGTISVQQLMPKKAAAPGGGVAPKPDPKTDGLPASPARPAAKTAPGSASVKPPAPRTPPRTNVEDAAAALLDGRDPGEVTGDFTEPDASHAAPDPNATGDFTEPDVPPKPAAKPISKQQLPPAKPAVAASPQATGDFTEAESSAAAKPGKATQHTDPQATGDFTEPVADEASERPREQSKPKAKHEEVVGDGSPADGTAPPRLGGYEVLKVLGKGGMGAVLLGRQISLDRKVALKVMHPKVASNPTFVARFTREAYAAAQLTHHNVVQIYDIGEDRGQQFFSMEFVQGQSLMDIVKKEGKVTPEAAVGYVLQAARGLRYGHNQGMVHRDIKPDNLMINTEGVVKVADLGLVKIPGGEVSEKAGAVATSDEGELGDSNLTRAGAVMGTPAYMSPEQTRDSGTVDARADIYSLGCTLYVLATGKPPFEGKTALEVISKHQNEPMTPPEVVVKRIPKALSIIILKMTAKKPEDRYQSMDEVITTLEAFLGVEKAGTFNPKEEQAEQLEKCCHQFNYRARIGAKRKAVAAFFALCLLGILGGAFLGMPSLAGGVLGLMLMAPLAYFVVHGTATHGVLLRKARALVFGMRITDWAMWVGGGLLFLVTLYLFGWLWSWLGFALLAAGLGFGLWYAIDRAAAATQEGPLEEARGLFKSLRLSGLDEEQLRQFVCKYSGTNWEPFYEALFGYEAKLAARAYRKGETGEPSRKAGAWREPLVVWLDARLEARREATERRHLQKVEAKALEAEGVSKADAKLQAEAMAAELVDKAAEAKKSQSEGKAVSIAELVAAARERKKPRPGYNIAGVPLRSMGLKNFLNDWFGRRLRFVVGAAVFAIGLIWLHQNGALGHMEAVTTPLLAMDFDAAGKAFDTMTAKTLTVPSVLPVPNGVLKMLSTPWVPILGLLVMISALLHFGWPPTVAAVPGLILGIAGPTLGVPAIGPLTAQQVCAVVGAVLILGVGWFIRR